MSISAMKMALEAMEFNGNIWHIDCKKDDTIAALRQAIEQAEKPSTGNVLMDAYNAMVAKQQQAEKQEPYGYLWFTHHMERRFTHYKPKEEQRIGDVKPVYAAPVDAVNISQERVDETAKGEHEPVVGTKTWFEDGKVITHNLYPSDIYSAPVDAVNMSQEHVDETVKGEHEPWPSVQCVCGGTIYFKHTKREWVGLTDDEIYDYADKFLYQHGSNYGIRSFGKAIEATLKEKNT